jgi:hypothetical protein
MVFPVPQKVPQIVPSILVTLFLLCDHSLHVTLALVSLTTQALAPLATHALAALAALSTCHFQVITMIVSTIILVALALTLSLLSSLP